MHAVYARAKGARSFRLIAGPAPIEDIHADYLAAIRRGSGNADVEEVVVDPAGHSVPKTIKTAELAGWEQGQIEGLAISDAATALAEGLTADFIAAEEAGEARPYVKRETGTDEGLARATSRRLRMLYPRLSAMSVSRYGLFAGTPDTYEVILTTR